MWPAAGARIRQTDGLHGTEGQGFAAPRRHHLDGQAPFEVARLLERVRLHLFAGEQLVDEALVFVARQRQVQVIVAAALAVARLPERHCIVDGVRGDDRGDRVVERERRVADRLGERARQARARQRPGGDDAERVG